MSKKKTFIIGTISAFLMEVISVIRTICVLCGICYAAALVVLLFLLPIEDVLLKLVYVFAIIGLHRSVTVISDVYLSKRRDAMLELIK